MGWSITIDRETCIGSGLCVTYAAGTFDQDEGATAVLREPITDGLDDVRAAVDACPTHAITLHEDEEEGTP